MKLRQLFENIYEQNGDEFDGSLKVIGVCFGRFNPPHRGHKAVWQAAAANPIWYVGTNQSTSGPKDPLPYDVKLQAMAAVWPKVAGHVIPEQSLLTLAAKIYAEHGANVHLKVYTDEDWLVKTLTQYNGVEKEHGMYKFQQIDHVRTERLASATNLRAAVRNGDRAAFYKDMGIKPSVTINVGDKEYPVFDVVAHYLNKYPEKTKKAVAEIAGAFPSPSTREKWAKDAAASNAAEAKRQLQLKAQQLQTNTAEVDRLQKINHHSLAPNTTAPIPADEGIFDSKPKVDWNKRAKELFAKGMTEQQVAQQLAKEGCPPNQVNVYVQAGQLEEASGYIPKNKKEAKDPRWSTALTKDVTIGAIGKNLRAFKLAEQIAEMERELIESSEKNITKRVQQSTAGLNTYGDSERMSGDYTAYRLGMAVAGADGKTPIDMKAKSWIGKKKSTHPYTKEEQDMLKQAYKAVGATYKDMNNGDMKSKELDSTNKASPVATPKKNKYGV
jgi:nicotinamide mononucleotide adenylyltransferase